MSRLTTKTRRAATRRRAWQWNYRQRYFYAPFEFRIRPSTAWTTAVEASGNRLSATWANAIEGLYRKARP